VFNSVFSHVIEHFGEAKLHLRKKLQIYKPDSVTFTEVKGSVIYLDHNIAVGFCSAYPPCITCEQQLPNQMAGDRVYLAFQSAGFIR
jgi:hypothetical protein